MFIEPGTLGYRTDCTENSKVTDKILLNFVLFNGDYKQIEEDMLEFILGLPDCGELPPLYCLPKYKRQNQLVLPWHLSRVQEDLAVEVRFKLTRERNKSTNTSLSMSSLSGCDTKEPSIYIAEVQLDRVTFVYTSWLSCCWHEDLDTSRGPTDKVNRGSYMLLSLCCLLYGLELVPGKHCPVEEMVRSIAGSITTNVGLNFYKLF